MLRITALLLLASVSWSGEQPARFAKLDAAMQAMIDQQQVAGAVVVVAHANGTAYLKAFGEQAPGVAMKRDTIFRIYSMSKPITVAAALMLVDEGKLKLDDPLAKFVPALAKLTVFNKTENEGKPKRAPTVRDLLTHTAGFSYGFEITPVDAQYQSKQVLGSKDLRALAETVATLPLANEPGARWHYSVANDLLARVVEVVSGQPFDKFLAQRIFTPLGMPDTGFHVPKEKISRFAANYGPKLSGKGLRVVDGTKTSRYARPATLFSGGGGLVSTAADYLRFCRMLARGGELDGKRILKRETVAAMTSNQLPEQLVPIRIYGFAMVGIGFGHGLSVRVADEPAVAKGEYGWGGAASTGFSISPAQDLIVITLVQRMPFFNTPHTTAKLLAYAADAAQPKR